MQLSSDQIKEVYDLHIKIINTYLEEPRRSKVLEMIEELGEDYVLSPASSRTWFHGAYPGGYLTHVNTVVRTALSLLGTYKKLGGIVDFTEEELVFSALFHDLGKTGNGEKPGYVVQSNEWRSKNLQEPFTPNPEIDFMLIPDRSLYLLQKFGIQVSQREYLAIKLHDGLFEESNKAYFLSFNPEAKLRSNIVPILHAADYLASRIEVDREKREE